jgi:hypothetical protein
MFRSKQSYIIILWYVTEQLSESWRNLMISTTTAQLSHHEDGDRFPGKALYDLPRYNSRESDRPGFDFRQCKIFLISTAFRPSLEPTLSPIQCVPGLFLRGLGGRVMKLTIYHHLVPTSRKAELYLHSPLCIHGVIFY